MSAGDVAVAGPGLYHLQGVPEAVGEEVGYCVETSTGATRVTCRVHPGQDLILNEPCDVTFVVPAGYPLFLSSPADSSSSSSPPPPSIEVLAPPPFPPMQFSWLANSNYPLSVWFYTARNALKRPTSEPGLEPHTTPVLLRSAFPYSPPMPSTTTSSSSSSFSSNPNPVTIITGAGRTRGKRAYMEDVDFVYPPLRVSEFHKAVSVIGVLDGHGGAECAQFVADEMPARLAALLKAQPSRLCHLAQVLHSAVLQVDAEFIASAGCNAGSTACILLWDGGAGNERGYVANTGDTRAVLCRSGRALDLTLDRKASDPEEVARIAQCGGFVQNGRVQGSLAVSRALGDCDLKKGQGRFATKRADGTKTRGPTDILIPDPEVTTFTPLRPRSGAAAADTPTDEYVLIATDGLWDVMSSQAACDAVARRLVQAGKSLDGAGEADIARLCDGLATEAVSLGSQDNVTVRMVVFRGESSASASASASASEGQAEGMAETSGGAGLATLRVSAAAAAAVPAAKVVVGSSSGSSSSASVFRGEDRESATLGRTSNAYSSSSSSSSSRAEPVAQPRRAVPKEAEGEGDDLMSFLLDDGNF